MIIMTNEWEEEEKSSEREDGNNKIECENNNNNRCSRKQQSWIQHTRAAGICEDEHLRKREEVIVVVEYGIRRKSRRQRLLFDADKA